MQYVTRKAIIRNIVGTVRNKQFQLYSSERCVFLVTKTSNCSEKNNWLYTANCTATEYTICPFTILLISLVFPRYRYTARYQLFLNKIEYSLINLFYSNMQIDFYSKLQASDEQILLPIFVYTYRCVYDSNKIIRLREI